jgi:hypothetical protein
MATITSAGAVPSSPQSLLNAEIAAATALSPGLTANLPGSLIEDMASTAAGALVIQDQAFVDLVNSVSPYTANAPILYELGAVYGVQQGVGSNTSVYVTFSTITLSNPSGNPGYVIPVGFVVSDGSYQYTVQDGGIIGSSGNSSPLYCIATVSGSWAVPIGTVTVIITSVPSGINLSCTNASTGIPGASAQTLQDYQAQVIQAGKATAQGMPSFLRTQLQNVSGVQARLISIAQSGSNWQIIVGGGDPYQVANAIFTGLFDVGNLVGSIFTVSSISAATNAVIVTPYNPQYTVGQTITVVKATPTAYNTTYVITGLSYAYSGTGVTTTITTSTNSSAFGAFTATSAYLTPNTRNPSPAISIYDYPNTYTIPFVIPPQQTVTVALTWNTVSTSFVSPTSVAAAGIPAIVNYINSIAVGQPINVYELQAVFQLAVVDLIPTQLLSKISFAIEINGISVSPSAGTGLIYGDSESFFETSNAYVTVIQG